MNKVSLSHQGKQLNVFVGNDKVQALKSNLRVLENLFLPPWAWLLFSSERVFWFIWLVILTNMIFFFKYDFFNTLLKQNVSTFGRSAEISEPVFFQMTNAWSYKTRQASRIYSKWKRTAMGGMVAPKRIMRYIISTIHMGPESKDTCPLKRWKRWHWDIWGRRPCEDRGGQPLEVRNHSSPWRECSPAHTLISDF